MRKLIFLNGCLIFILAFTLASCGTNSKSNSENNNSKRLKINGSTTVNPVAVSAANLLRNSEGIEITVDVQGGSSGGVSHLAEGLAEIGMISKPLSEKDKSRFKHIDFQVHSIGQDAIAIAVSKAVYEGGVQTITKQQAKDLFEGKIKNWKELNGPDLPVFVYDKEAGRGTREVFEQWIYGKQLPPILSFSHRAEIGGNEEGRTKTAQHGSAVTLLSAAWIDDKSEVRALALKLEGIDRSPISATNENIAAGHYPLARPLNLITNGKPKGNAKKFITFLLSKDGQKLILKNGYLPIVAPKKVNKNKAEGSSPSEVIDKESGRQS